MIHEVIDQMGSPVSFSFPPKRIISLVPSQTELLFDLGLEKEVIGITKFCVHPPNWQREKYTIGGTKNIKVGEIIKLDPDLIIGNKEENAKERIETLKEKYPVWMSDIKSFDDATDMIGRVGEITNAGSAARKINNDIQHRFGKITRVKGSALYLIWKKPWMAAGRDTFINSMLEMIGLTNVVTSQRYPEITTGAISDSGADFIFLSSEPYPFKEKDIAEVKSLSMKSKVLLVDGQMFSWYGSRLKLTPAYLDKLDLSHESC